MHGLSGISREHLVLLETELATRGMGSPIEVDEGQSLGLIDELSLLGRRLCAKASASNGWDRPLHFLPLESPKRNAYAFWVGPCDVVHVTAPLMREIEAFSTAAAAMALKEAYRPGPENSFGCLVAVTSNDAMTADALAGLIAQGTFAFLVGHEIGHLTAGHLGVIQKYPLSDQVGPAGTCAIDEHLASADIAPDEASPASLARNSIEVDADVQGCQHLVEHWRSVLRLAKTSEQSGTEAEKRAAVVFSILLADEKTCLFLSTVCAATGIALLGFGTFDADRLLTKSHPLSAMRILVNMRVLTAMYESNGDAQLALVRSKCAEAITFVHAVLGQLLLDARKAGLKIPTADLLAASPATKRLDLVMGFTGMGAAIDAMEAIGDQVIKLASAFEGTWGLRRPHRRWPANKLVQWSHK